jgi:hypothetical protein
MYPYEAMRSAKSVSEMFKILIPNTMPENPKPSNGSGSAQVNKGDGVKIAGNIKPIEPIKYLYFVFYTHGNNPKINQAVKKEAIQSAQNIKKYKYYNVGKDIIYLVKIPDPSQTHKFIKQKIAETKGKFKGAILCTEVKLKPKQKRDSSTMGETFKKLGNKITDGKISDGVGVAFNRFFNEGVPDMWNNSPWYAKAPLVHAGAIAGVGISHGGLLATNAFLRNPAEYSQGAIDVIEAYLPGPPPMSKTGVFATVGFMFYNYEETIDDAKESFEAIKKSIESYFNHGK